VNSTEVTSETLLKHSDENNVSTFTVRTTKMKLQPRKSIKKVLSKLDDSDIQSG
jgi:hypothetical protein